MAEIIRPRGKFVVVDGIDGVGKGVFLETFVAAARADRMRIFDVHQFWKEHDRHPDPESIIGHYDIILTSEPTFAGIGRYIREEMIAENGRDYSPEVVAEAYALDRKILYEKLLIPVMREGVDVYQSRSFSSSITYQRQSALDQGRDFSISEILAIPGNAFCLKHPMDFLVVPTIGDVQEAIRRAEAREKDDCCVFENFPFQLKIKERFDSDEFREVFSNINVPVVYMDAGKTLEFSEHQAREFYQKELRRRIN